MSVELAEARERPQPPAVCRIVLFRSDNPGLVGGGCNEVPAIITQVHADGRVNLQVFRDAMEVAAVFHVPFYDGAGPWPAGCSWRWPRPNTDD